MLGQEYSYIVKATDADNDPIKFSLDVIIEGMKIEKIDDYSARITWFPKKEQKTYLNSVILISDDGRENKVSGG